VPHHEEDFFFFKSFFQFPCNGDTRKKMTPCSAACYKELEDVLGFVDSFGIIKHFATISKTLKINFLE